MRIVALAAAALALSACGGGESSSTDEANAFGTDNMMMGDNMMMDANGSMDGMGSMDANASTNAAIENMMMQDAVTNDADTNLANGL